jgi:hypothetical protein
MLLPEASIGLWQRRYRRHIPLQACGCKPVWLAGLARSPGRNTLAAAGRGALGGTKEPWARRGRRRGALGGSTERARNGGARKCRLFFLLCCRCCQALLRIFFSLHAMLFRRCVTWPRSRWRLPVALGPRVSNDLLSVRVQTPVTRCSLRLSTTAGRPVGGDPIYTTAPLPGPEE